MNSPIVCGIDYSITAPAITIHRSPWGWAYDNCHFFYLTDKKKCELNINIGMNKFVGSPHKDFSCQEERHDNISEWALDIIKSYNVSAVYIEDYAFAAHGRVFNIGENCGLLKHKIWKYGITPITFAPSMIKKFATGKGNAQKQGMYDAFFAETQQDFHKIFGTLGIKNQSPTSDIVDSYYIAKYGFLTPTHTLAA